MGQSPADRIGYHKRRAGQKKIIAGPENTDAIAEINPNLAALLAFIPGIKLITVSGVGVPGEVEDARDMVFNWRVVQETGTVARVLTQAERLNADYVRSTVLSRSDLPPGDITVAVSQPQTCNAPPDPRSQ